MAVIKADISVPPGLEVPVPTAKEKADLIRIRAQLFQVAKNNKGTEDAANAERMYKEIDKKLAPWLYKELEPEPETPLETGVRHFASSATLGASDLLGDAVVKRAVPGSDAPTGRAGETPMDLVHAGEHAGSAKNPGAAIGGELLGAAAPVGGPSMLFKAAGKAFKGLKVAREAPVLAHVAAGAGRGLGTTAIAAPVVGGVRAGLSSDLPLRERFQAAAQAMADEATSIPNYALGAGLGAVGGLAQSIPGRNTQTSRDIATIEDLGEGAKPTPFGGAKGGMFETPELKNKTTDADRGSVAMRAGNSIRQKLNKVHEDASTEFKAAEDEARNSGALARKIDPFPLYDDAVKFVDNELGVTSAAKSRVRTEILGPLQKYIDRGEGIPMEKWHGFSSKLKRLARLKTRTDADADSIAFGDLAQNAKNPLEHTPYGEMDAKYKDTKTNLKKAYQTMGFQDAPVTTKPDDPVAANKVANYLLQMGKDTETTGKRLASVEDAELETLFPQLKPDLRGPRLLGAKERLSFGLPTGGLHRNVLGAAGQQISPSVLALYLLGRRAPSLLPEATVLPDAVRASMEEERQK